MKVLLIFYEDRKILVDTGAGHKFPPKLQEIYGLDYQRFTLKQSLQEHHLQPEDITDVILTHCHFDHVGGATERAGEALQLTFPNATHYVQDSHWKWALESVGERPCQLSKREPGTAEAERPAEDSAG